MIPWRRERQPTPVFLPGKSHGWRSLAGYSPWGPKESDMTERLHFLFFHFLQSLLNVLQYCFFFMFWFWACEILAPQPRIKPTSPTLAGRFFTTVPPESEVTQSCPTLCDPMDCSLPGSSIHGIFQARVLEWVAIAFSLEQWTGSKLRKK